MYLYNRVTGDEVAMTSPRKCTMVGSYCPGASTAQLPCPAGYSCSDPFSLRECNLGEVSSVKYNVSSILTIIICATLRIYATIACIRLRIIYCLKVCICNLKWLKCPFSCCFIKPCCHSYVSKAPRGSPAADRGYTAQIKSQR